MKTEKNNKKITNQNDVVKNYESDESIQDKVEKN